jgi:hypothetical protein
MEAGSRGGGGGALQVFHTEGMLTELRIVGLH